MGRAATVDQGSAERIRDAAMRGFADGGVKGTSIRDVAKAAGVSPGLVQHHFPNKAALQEAVDQHVLVELAETFSEIPEGEMDAQFFRGMGDQLTGFVREHPVLMRYVARSIIEGEEAALRIFDASVAMADAHTERLKEKGYFREDIDTLWAPLHLVIFNLACVLFETALDRRLPAPFHTPEMLDRWNRATTEMFQIGYEDRDCE